MPLVSFKAGEQFIGQPGVRRIGNQVFIPRSGIATKAKRLVVALGEGAVDMATGKPVFVSKEVENERRAICNVCEFWQPEGHLGFGECAHPKCGCTRIKMKLAKQRCPLAFWRH